ncbi:hypothetical protein [Alienimonas sp. DA493]|uniref:hypothetical protein n=1 Tax=Alienimonas sp. DA493 TaxID=3373605 RepID=UPI0037547FFF
MNRTPAPFDPNEDLAPDGTPLAARLPDAADWLPTLEPGDGEAAALVARLAALCDRRGVPAFAPPGKENRIAAALRRLAEPIDWPEGAAAPRLLAALPPNRARGLSFPPWERDAAPGFLSDPAAVGLLRSGWNRTADAVALAWPDGGPSLELRARGRRLFSGTWGLSVAIDGDPLDLTDGWACVCHHADDDGGFLELQWSGECAAGPVRVERQAFLSRDGGFAALSDAVRLTGPEATDAVVEHAMTLPVAAGLSAGVAPDTREARLFGGRKNWQRGRVFPLALPQYPGGPEPGSIEAADAALTVRHRARGGLVAPVAIDWNRWREDDPADWRTLTVTENRRRLGPAHAGAHRLRIGRKHHLFLYRRTDDSPAPRAALGHHHSWETLIARFSRKGEVSPLLRV